MCVLARINKADEGSSMYLCDHLKALMDLKGKYSYHTEGPQPEGQKGEKKSLPKITVYFYVQACVINVWALFVKPFTFLKNLFE